MRTKITLLFCFLLSISSICAQQTPSEVKYKIWDMHALRYYPFTTPADSIIKQVLEKTDRDRQVQTAPRRTVHLDIAANAEYLNTLRLSSQLSNHLLNKLLFRPYREWFQYMETIGENKKEVSLNVLQLLEPGEEDPAAPTSAEGIFRFPGNATVGQLLNDILGDADVFSGKNEVLMIPVSAPLCPDALDTYHFYLSSSQVVDGRDCFEVAFFSKQERARASEGLLYIDKKNYELVEAALTLNYSLSPAIGKNILMIHSFQNNRVRRKKTFLLLGDDYTTSLFVRRNDVFTSDTEDDPSFPENPEGFASLLATADNTRAWKHVQNAASLLFTDHIGIGKKEVFELGPITQTISYNTMEGLRLRLGGHTTTALNKHLTAGGYVAYGTKDKDLKYRGDLYYSIKPQSNSVFQFPQSLISLTWVDDLNIPGQDLLSTQRDNIFYSLSHSSVNNMSHQQIGLLSFSHELKNRLAFDVSGKYLRDKSVGVVQYDDYTTSELAFSLRYAPGEKTVQLRGRRFPLQQGDIVLRLNHRTGIKGLLGSDYHYQITELGAYKKFHLPGNAGTASFDLSAGKVWDQVPFPLLFIPKGNQSYVVSDEAYNLMKFYEFTTDQFIAGKLNMQFNWSPFSFFLPQWNIRTHAGFKLLYGPLSDKNNPALHPGLYPFNNGVRPLGDDPYMEFNVGLSNIFRFLRVDYVRRLSYLDDSRTLKGSIFIGTAIRF